MRRVDDDFFPPVRRRTRSGGGFPTWIGPVIGVGIVGLFVVFFVVLLAVRKRNERERADAARSGAPAESNALGPVPPDLVRPAPIVPNRPVPIVPGPFVPAPVRPAPALTSGLRETIPDGGFFAQNDYREYRPDRALLIGFEIGLGAVPDTAVVTYLRPIWLTARGEEFGTAYGRTRNRIATVKARDGYAIGGMRMKTGGAIEGICFTFMRRGAKHLNAGDSYVSDWYGEQTRKPSGDLRDGDGAFVVGIFGKRFDDKGGFEFDTCGGIGTIGLVLWVKE